LTLEENKELNDNEPISILSIIDKYKLDKLFLVENAMSSFVDAYKKLGEINCQLIFGLKLVVCNDAADKSETSLKTESKVIVWIKNSEGYKSMLQIYKKAFTDDFYYRGRTDWKTLNQLIDNNLSLSIPAYSSFLHNNILKGYNCIPDFGNLKPNILISDLGLPFDNILRQKHINYAKNNDLEINECLPIYHYSKKDWDAFCIYRAIQNRGSYSSPKIDNFGSDLACWENYCKQNKIKFYE
jgi:DNA polymerase III alpha subunit